jgi:putative transposase
MSPAERARWIGREDDMPLTMQCELAGVPRSTVYRRLETAAREECLDEEDGRLRALIDEEYTSRPFYGSRRMAVVLRGRPPRQPQARATPDAGDGVGGHGAGPGDEQGASAAQGLSLPVARGGGRAAESGVEHGPDVYPSGARLRLPGGDYRLVLAPRAGLARQQQHGCAFCVDCLEDALRHHGRPEVFNSDQGSQFTSDAFTGVLKREGVAISMDGRGRALDNIFVERLWRNVKYEDVYLKGYANMAELTIGLAQYFAFYNAERPHQALSYETPDHVYRAGVGGGALIVDRFDNAGLEGKEDGSTGQRRAAAGVEMDTA